MNSHKLCALALAGMALGLGTTTAQRSTTPENRPETALSSFTWADYDADGLEDAFVISPNLQGRLLRNRGDGTLEDVSELAGLELPGAARFALWEDVDADGNLDLLVGRMTGSALLYMGSANGTFVETTLAAGLASWGTSLHAAFLDYDRDGLPDLHLRTQAESLLFRNLGQGSFQPIELGLDALVPIGLTPGTAPLELEGEAGVPVERTASGAAPDAEETPAPGGRKALELTSETTRTTLVTQGESVDEAKLIAGAKCAKSIQNSASPGSCLLASSVPTMGQLFPISTDLYCSDVNGRVGVNTTNPLARLDARSGSGLELSAVRGWGPLSLGHLGAQGRVDFDGVLTADWPGYDLGAVGISIGGSITDNFGVIGHSNHVGVRGEYSGNPTGIYANLGNYDGVGIRAAGSVLAGDFLGQVDVSDSVNVTDGDFNVYAGTIQTVMVDGDDTAFGGGSQVFLDNIPGISTIELDADLNGNGSAGMAIRQSSGFNTIWLDGGDSDGGALARFTNDAMLTTIELDAENGTGGSIEMYNDSGYETIDLSSEIGGGAYAQFRNATGANRIVMDAEPYGYMGIYATDGSSTLGFYGEGLNSGGQFSLRNDVSQSTVELFGDSGLGNSGRISMWDRTASTNSVLLNSRDSAGTGAELVMRNQSGNVGFDLDAGGTVAAIMFLNETDGSTAMSFVNYDLNLYNSSGVLTVNFDRQTGTKSAVVDTPSAGQRHLYAMESPEVWFEDFGTGRLLNGSASVHLDPLFLETVTINDANPMRVFVTLNGDCAGVWVEKGSTGFTVHELGGGRSHAGFDYRVVAKRRGLEGLRLEPLGDAAQADLPATTAPAVLPVDGVDAVANAAERAAALPEGSDAAASGPPVQREVREAPVHATVVDDLPRATSPTRQPVGQER